MAEAVYAIEDFPADELLWRIEWIGGVGYNANVPSDPVCHVFLYISQQARKKLGLRRGRKERWLPQLLADADLKRFFRAIQDCGDVQHEILLKLLFYTAVRVSELVHIEVGDVDLD